MHQAHQGCGESADLRSTESSAKPACLDKRRPAEALLDEPLLLSAFRHSWDVQSLPPAIGADRERVRTEGTGHPRHPAGRSPAGCATGFRAGRRGLFKERNPLQREKKGSARPATNAEPGGFTWCVTTPIPSIERRWKPWAKLACCGPDRGAEDLGEKSINHRRPAASTGRRSGPRRENRDGPERRATKPEKPASRAISRGKTAVEDGMSRQRYHWQNVRRQPDSQPMLGGINDARSPASPGPPGRRPGDRSQGHRHGRQR